jgi:hypothetical protein
VRVARESIDTTELRVREAEQAAMAEAALLRFETAAQVSAAGSSAETAGK